MLVCVLCVFKQCVCTHVRNSTFVPAVLLNVALRYMSRCSTVESRACVQSCASHVWTVSVCFMPWIRVSRSNPTKCVFTHQIESEREKETSQRKYVWKRGSQRDLNALIYSLSADSKCFPKTADNGTRHGRERAREIERERERKREREREGHSRVCCPVQSCHFLSVQGQLCHFRTTRLLVSGLECAGSRPSGPFTASCTLTLCPFSADCGNL